ncbi:GNAT family N-acetyltransferase [Arthrobacter sp. ISL-69]|uniref:GNAT family N-acetyltransferase n=1 Tax=Arthrobacter sp. ISL-69 TaxID=2819113 RepID=UPI001BE52DB5|nr:GNAT family protein [Arthrobacter sp. ISL-69]MBT2536262.1 GNAT family N-acetyltransferase [Arthrobacter sp. ISL-69]
MTESHVRLRPFKNGDLTHITQWFDGRVGTFASGVTHNPTVDELAPSVAEGRDARIVETDNNEIVGVVSWSKLSYDGNFLVGIALAPEHVGTGYGALSLEQVLAFLFDQMRAHRLEFRTAGYNHHVLGMMTTGFITIEGILRDHLYVDGKFEVLVIGSILEHEYRAQIAAGKVLPVSHFNEEDRRKSAKSLHRILNSDRVPKSW